MGIIDYWVEVSKIAYGSDAELFDDAVHKYFKRAYYGNKLEINIPIQEIQKNKGYNFIRCKGNIGSIEVECSVAFSAWQKLRLTQKEIQQGCFNILAHLTELLPTDKKIGLVTYQNGIANSYVNFIEMGDSIIKMLSEGVLCIGLYNESWGVIDDLMNKLPDEMMGKMTETVARTKQMFVTLADTLSQNISKVLWLHIAHSEGGIIAKLAISNISEIDQKLFIKKNMICATYGAVAPISTKIALNPINTYSDEDKAALRYGKLYLNHPDYDIRIVNSVTPKNEQESIPGDHNFRGKTYQDALSKNIKEFRRNYTIYDPINN